ncbi:MAG: 3-deoxy-8-phosphooctulonate synthase [Acidobacteriota bacterium]
MTVGPGQPLAVIAGPCVIESPEHVVEVALALREEAKNWGVPLVFKASFDKANRSSLESYRGPGLRQGLAALAAVKAATGLPILTDVHEPAQAEVAAEVVDVLQVPAFLCRQTDLLLACGRTGRAVNIKKGQFMAPHDMANAVAKVRSTGNDDVTLTERGVSFGYNNLVVDMRALPMMRRLAPVVFDVTHSLQLPGGLGHATGGAREYHLHLARAAVAAGVDALFVEVHPDPPHALSDAATQLSLAEFRTLLQHVVAIRAAFDSLA